MNKENLFADRVKKLRLDTGLTQKMLSQMIGISPQTLNDIEKGRTNATLERATYIAQIFNVSLDYLVGLSEDSTISTLPAFSNDPLVMLPMDEQELLVAYRSLSVEDHLKLQEILKSLKAVCSAYNFRHNLNNE